MATTGNDAGKKYPRVTLITLDLGKDGKRELDELCEIINAEFHPYELHTKSAIMRMALAYFWLYKHNQMKRRPQHVSKEDVDPSGRDRPTGPVQWRTSSA